MRQQEGRTFFRNELSKLNSCFIFSMFVDASFLSRTWRPREYGTHFAWFVVEIEIWRPVRWEERLVTKLWNDINSNSSLRTARLVNEIILPLIMLFKPVLPQAAQIWRFIYLGALTLTNTHFFLPPCSWGEKKHFGRAGIEPRPSWLIKVGGLNPIMKPSREASS